MKVSLRTGLFRFGAAMHFFHSKQHDLMLHTPSPSARFNKMLNQEPLDLLTHLPQNEPDPHRAGLYFAGVGVRRPVSQG